MSGNESQSTLSALYEAHADALFAFLLNLTRDEEATRDLLHAVFAKLARDPAALSRLRRPRPYLLKMAHNLAIDLRRKVATERRHLVAFASEAQDTSIFEEEPRDDAVREAVEQAVATLPEEQRTVLHLRVWEEMSFRQISDVLGIPRQTAVSRYRYAIEKLGGLLATELGAELRDHPDHGRSTTCQNWPGRLAVSKP